MPSPRPSPSSNQRAAKVLVTLLAVILAIVVVNTRRGNDESATTLSTQSLLTLPGDQDPTATAIPTEIPTTAPVQLPTATSTTAPTPEPTATLQPTATPTTAAPAAAPEQRAGASGDVSIADAGSVAAETTAQRSTVVAPTADVQPTATSPAPTAAPTLAAPTAEPTASPEPSATSEPTASPRPTASPQPTATPEPTPTRVPVQTVAQLENYVLGEINRVRANAGLSPVLLDPTISNISRDWSQQMALGGFFEHRPGAELNVMLPAGWLQWGENIASAPDIFWAQSSLENSPGHYANMVGPFTHVGIGVYTNGSQVWLTHNFARY